MGKVVAEPIDVDHRFESPVNVTNLRYDWGVLEITLASGGDARIASVRFDEVIGFRFLDEGDLLEFWPICAADNGWIFKIKRNGWFDLEVMRKGFLKGGSQCEEYFVASQNGCVSVLTGEAPKVAMLLI